VVQTPGSRAFAPAPARARSFERRHNSIMAADLDDMLRVVGFKSVDALIDATVPANIRREVRARAKKKGTHNNCRPVSPPG
jgi:glycine cleavage system pyridoxal-binding protein P